MEKILEVTLQDKKKILINEDQVCFIEQGESGEAILTMSSGDKLICLSPCYEEWENDQYIRTT